jgi:hypothetical protein
MRRRNPVGVIKEEGEMKNLMWTWVLCLLLSCSTNFVPSQDEDDQDFEEEEDGDVVEVDDGVAVDLPESMEEDAAELSDDGAVVEDQVGEDASDEAVGVDEEEEEGGEEEAVGDLDAAEKDDGEVEGDQEEDAESEDGWSDSPDLEPCGDGPGCLTGELCCSGACVPIDEENCYGCGNRCAQGEPCDTYYRRCLCTTSPPSCESGCSFVSCEVTHGTCCPVGPHEEPAGCVAERTGIPSWIADDVWCGSCSLWCAHCYDMTGAGMWACMAS